MKLNILNKVPSNLLSLDIKDIHNLLEGPTLIHIKSKSKKDPLFLSTLLHGNETTSYVVLQKLLTEYNEDNLPRDLIIFLGNTLAASEGMRHLPGQMDYNRIWEEGKHLENKLALEVVEYAKAHNVFASIDIHNNTGKNPLYGCINSLEEPFLALASYFGDHTVYFTEPHNVQSMAFSKITPSITIECGLPASEPGIENSYKFVKEILHMDKLTHNPKSPTTEVFHTIARMKVNPAAKIDFEDSPETDADISFIPDLDEHNFEIIPKNNHLGYIRSLSLLKVEDNNGKDITDHFLHVIDGELLTNFTFIPSMFTKDIFVMKEDCLGYIMEIKIPVNPS